MESQYFYRRVASQVHIARIIPYLENEDVRLRDICKHIDITYATVASALQDAYSEGLIDRYRDSNVWRYNLTSKGKALCELCKGISEVIENWEGDVTLKKLESLNFRKLDKEKGYKYNQNIDELGVDIDE